MSAQPVATTAPQQLWLDVDRPIAPRPRRPADPDANARPKRTDPLPGGQIELRLRTILPSPVAVDLPAPEKLPAPVSAQATAQTTIEPEAMPAPRSFAAWLLDQAKRPGTLGDLAKAARLDRAFPKTGDADAVRLRFSRAGADGDAFEALDDAEREYDRAC